MADRTPSEVATAFYQAFSRNDWQTMVGLYADDADFSDPVFQALTVDQVRAMWKMLVTGATDLHVVFQVKGETGDQVFAHWTATYTFSATGRKVVNEIDATMTVRNGRIVHHQDRFSFWRWSRQALGVSGLLLGWTPIVQNKVRGTAAKSLKQFQASDGKPASRK